MKNLLIMFLFLCFLPCVASEIETIKIDTKINLEIIVATAKDSIFPEKCLGVWEGIMHIYSQGIKRDSVNVKFTAAKTDTSGTYIWKTEYLSKTTPMVKDYKLVVDNLKEGRYILDEGDGSKIVEYVVNNKMYSLFKVEDIYLTSSTELVNKQLLIEVTSGKELKEIQGVKSYSFANVQRLVLTRMD